MAKIKTRFAPSPTGYLHVGGARTALFNYLLARGLGGTFLVRIEDTDVERHQEQAVSKIVEDLRWLGIEWDEGIEVGGPNGPYRQSQRLDIYAGYVQKLLDAGKAYYAFETPQELDAMRRTAEARKQNFRYGRPDPLPTAADARRAQAAGRPVVVRFLCPNRDVTVHDDAFGEVTMPAAEMDDFIIRKADGYPTYHPANVIDDALMGVTYIMRGQEFLGQTWRHVLLREAWGFLEPGYCHLPLILNTDGSKLGKRDKAKIARRAAKEYLKQHGRDALEAIMPGDLANLRALVDDGIDDVATAEVLAEKIGTALPEVDVHDFRVAGYLPEVLVNFIALLGWGPPGDRERLTLEEMILLFSTDRIGKTNARFDRDKLLAFNTDASAAAPADRLLKGFKDYLSLHPESLIPASDEALLHRLLKATKGFRTFADIQAKCGVLFGPDEAFNYDDKAVDKVLKKGGESSGFAVLVQLRPMLQSCDWTAEALEKLISDFCQSRSLGMGKVAQPIRVAVTGSTISPSIYDTLAFLGKAKTLARIDRCLKRQTA